MVKYLSIYRMYQFIESLCGPPETSVTLGVNHTLKIAKRKRKKYFTIRAMVAGNAILLSHPI